MRSISRYTVCVLGAAMSLAAHAQAPMPAALGLKAGVYLYSTDDRRIGRVEKVIPNKDGTAGWASLIVDGRFVSVPVMTITSSDRGFTTSLSKADIRKLK